MSEQYTHLLIARPAEIVPSGSQVEKFLQAMVTKGVVPGPIELFGTAPTGEVRKINFGAFVSVFERSVPFPIASLEEIAAAVEQRPDFTITVSGTGRPALPPLPIDFAEPYAVTVRCRVSSVCRSTSNPLNGNSSGGPVVPFGQPCPVDPGVGYFFNPHTGAEIKLPEAGCARFWIELELGKYLFPAISGESLDLLHPALFELAGSIFETRFVQACTAG
jgi:hypothetical protein